MLIELEGHSTVNLSRHLPGHRTYMRHWRVYHNLCKPSDSNLFLLCLPQNNASCCRSQQLLDACNIVSIGIFFILGHIFTYYDIIMVNSEPILVKKELKVTNNTFF